MWKKRIKRKVRDSMEDKLILDQSDNIYFIIDKNNSQKSQITN